MLKNIILFLLLINFTNALYEYCDEVINLKETMYIVSPNYRQNYYPGSSCRYQIIAPLDHQIYINCNIKYDVDVCKNQFFYINTEGDRKLREYEVVCRSGNIKRKSLFNKMTISYLSSSGYDESGSFSCLATLVKQTECDCGWSLNTKIVGGTETGLTEYPFMAGLIDEYENLFCSGSVISRNIILTAAHCLTSYNASKVVVGAHNVKEPSMYTKYYIVQEVRKHENYNPTKNENDIAIIATKTNMEWSRGVGPVCLPFLYYYNTFVGEPVDFAGWGTTLFGGPRSDILLKATVDVIDNSVCYNDDVTDNKMCTYRKSYDSCQFDSGGPVIWRGDRLHILGIISYGKACGSNSPGVNTRITSYLDWIQLNTVDNYCTKY